MQQDETIIQPPGMRIDFSVLRQHRDLLYFFVWRDVKVKYKQTLLGFAWVLLQPLTLMTMFYFIFSRTLQVETGIHYLAYVLSGLILWELFSSGIRNSSDSLVENAAMIRKIYFPRILIPLAALIASLLDFAIAFVLLLVVLVIVAQPVGLSALLYFPAGLLLTFFASFGAGILLGAMNVKYRDFRYLLPFLIQLLFFGSQVVYSIHQVSDPLLRDLLYINPLNGALELFRAPFYNESPHWPGIGISTITTLILVISGLFYFKKTEAFFADLV